MGGLDKFLKRFDDELQPLLSDRPTYREMAPEQRALWVDELLPKIRGANPTVVEAPRSAPAAPQKARTAPRKPRTRQSKPSGPLKLSDDVSRLKGAARQTVPRLKRLGIERVGDFLYHFPTRHNDFGNARKINELEPGIDQTVVATLWEATETSMGPRKKSTQAVLGDETGNVRVTWFNQPWLAKTLKPGMQLAVSGKVKVFRGNFVFESPEHEVLDGSQKNMVHTGRMVPVYPSTDGLYQRTIRNLVKQVLDSCIDQVEDYVPDEILKRNGLIGVRDAIMNMHYPDSEDDRRVARKRLAFDEMFMLQLAVMTQKRLWKEGGEGRAIPSGLDLLEPFFESLPFQLTGAQYRVIEEVFADIRLSKPMRRMLQGDVGSGKTVVAAAAMLASVQNGYQSALMAPTEILAEQHFLTICSLLSETALEADGKYVVTLQVAGMDKQVVVGLLLGSHRKRVKDDVYAMLTAGSIDIIIGTHALIQSSVDIPNLALVVVDEQHRFGVMQRASLSDKGTRPHVLAMSATPIPRSLALTVYGDLDSSVIDEMPPGRESIRTRWVESERRDTAYGFVRKEVEAGRQAFIVCPLIEESEAIQSRAAVVEHERLSKQVFPDLKVGLLHGRMPLKEKEEIMDSFKSGEINILVSTPVIEVGIDVPNATVMLIDGADRFGLSQLHQFRGRVGRGEHQSYCLLMADSPGMEARKRLKLLERVQDGFKLAEEDLKLRGPGDYAGTRQSGLPSLKVASILDQDILALARREAIRLLEADPELTLDDNEMLGQQLKKYSGGLTADIS
jgi:ATP-dependent DNA helicase RecG